MRKLSLVILTSICIASISCKTQKQNNSIKMEKEIKTVIETFVKAGEKRNISTYNDILHKDFRVIANQYPSPENTSTLSAKQYTDLLSKEVIGGTKYNVIFRYIDISEHSATVKAELKSENGGQLVTFLLVQNPENKWLIITDMATQTK